jgi:hypothetical protein
LRRPFQDARLGCCVNLVRRAPRVPAEQPRQALSGNDAETEDELVGDPISTEYL